MMTTKKEIVRFSLAGALVTATDFGIYYCLIYFLPFSIAKGISFTGAGMVGYLLNKHWIFKHHQPSSAEVGRYALINILALGINVVTNQSMLNARPGAVFAALVMATTLTAIFTFVCFKWWVFRPGMNDREYFAWWKWFPWRFLVRDAARRHGFLDPIKILAQLQNFAQPSEVAAPTELIRSGVVIHARGLMNSLAIQHNLDWIWPYWVECQYDPRNEAFIPRAFSLTQINLTHRNWTAVGVPDGTEFPLVDPRGLVTPGYDGWSLDAWIIPAAGEPLIPSRLAAVDQKLVMADGLEVITECRLDTMRLQTMVRVIGPAEAPVCQLHVSGWAQSAGQLVISLRPYNPEGVSFVNDIAALANRTGWQVNRDNFVHFDIPPERCEYSYYHHGDVYRRLARPEDKKGISCRVGMASAAAVYELAAAEARDITVSVPFTKTNLTRESAADDQRTAQLAWQKSLHGTCALQIPDGHFQFLYDAAVRTMILHSPGEVYPGPYIYRRFWFRDAAFILQAMLCVGLNERVRRALDCFRSRQTAHGYFLSQEGEWDANGEALWIMRQYCALTGNIPPREWRESINKAGLWIVKKRLPVDLPFPHAGLLLSGFSAEHLGPNDFYYWDDFWAVAGLNAAAWFATAYRENDAAGIFAGEAQSLRESIQRSLQPVGVRLQRPAIPASPYRRMDTGAIGSLAASYPLRIFGPQDPRILDTAEYLMENCLVHGGFFHDMTHSGINPYLTLHLAQVLLRAGDSRYFGLMTAVARLATPTGQWPESVHPRTGGGCMGDGQHVWAAAEWVLMIRNCFVREEDDCLILCSGIPPAWLKQQQAMAFGPAPTSFGDITITIKPDPENTVIAWVGTWFAQTPKLEVRVPGFPPTRVQPPAQQVMLKRARTVCASS